jgi:hypothetical protein
MYDLNKAVFIFDLKFKKEMSEDFMIQEISKIIADWNSKKSYNIANSNCQHFVNEILERLGLYNEEGDLEKMINLMKEKGCYTLKELLPEVDKLKFSNHKDLDYEYHKNSWNGKNNSGINMKPFDRAIWLNYFVFSMRFEFFMKIRNECNVSLKKLNSYNETITRNALKISSENSFFQFKFPNFVSPLQTHIGELNEGVAIYEEEKSEIKKSLRILWTEVVEYTKEKIQELKDYLENYAEPITTSEMIKRFLKEHMKEVEFAKMYPEDHEYPVEIDLNHEIVKKIPLSTWTNLKLEQSNQQVIHHCPFGDPMSTQSFTGNK